MKIAMIVEAHMLPVPLNIEVLQDWAAVGVVDDQGQHLASGRHMYLEGQTSDFVEWLGGYDGIWRTVPGTSVMMQRFEVVHITEAS